MSSKESPELAKSIGKKVVAIDISESEVLLTFSDKSELLIHHEFLCCEKVHLVGIEGNVASLIGSVVSKAEVHVDNEYWGDEDFLQLSATESKVELNVVRNNSFRVSNDVVIMRWIGTSNGCYGEEVSFEWLKEFGSKKR